MPTLTTTTTVTTAVEISPRLRRKLKVELIAWAELKAARAEIDKEMDTRKTTIDALRAETGENNLALDGFKISLVSPTRSTLDKKRLLENGVSMGQIENSTVVSATKPYIKISTPAED